MNFRNKNIASLFILLSFAATILSVNILNPPRQILTYDTFGYYLYLPGIFIYDQLEYSDPSKLEELNEQYGFTTTFYQFVRAPNMKYLNKYSMGLAFLYLPFFLIAHLIANLAGFPADGLSPPYQYSLLVGGFIYSIIGVFILRKVLLRYFSDLQVAITLALLIFGTNYIYDAIFKGMMPHSMLFSVYALLIWLTIRWHEKPTLKYAVYIGLTAGLLILARPSEIVCMIIPLLWGVTGKESFKHRIVFWKKNIRHLIVAAGCVFMVWIPQMIYWKAITGSFLFYSYANPGEGFDFLSPHTWHVLFSFRKGWLIYSPIMVFALSGFYLLYKKNRELFWPLIIFFILNLYLVSSWTNWWYAESFGQRALIQSYAVMAVPLGFFVQHILDNRRKWLKVLILALSLVFIALNGFQIWQLRHGILDASRMTRAYYFSIFGKTSVTEDQKKLLIIERPSTSREFFMDEENYEKIELAFLGFEEKESDVGKRKEHYDSLVVQSGKYSFRMDSTWGFSPGYDIRFKDMTDKDHVWIRASVSIFPTADTRSNDALLVVTFNHKGRYYKYRGVRMSEPEFDVKPGQWNRVTMDYITPEVRSKRDKLSIYVWYQGNKPFYVDDLKVEVFERKPSASRRH
jgi:hypothetical protein